VVELFAIFSLLLAGWGLFGRRTGAADESPVTAATPHERGSAARRLLR
jgi:hypothetical protein